MKAYGSKVVNSEQWLAVLRKRYDTDEASRVLSKSAVIIPENKETCSYLHCGVVIVLCFYKRSLSLFRSVIEHEFTAINDEGTTHLNSNSSSLSSSRFRRATADRCC